MHVKTVAASQGWDWIKRAFTLIGAAPGTWVALAFLFLLISIALAIIPFVGQLIMAILWPIFIAGMLSGCRDVERGAPLTVGHLFAGFRHPDVNQLVIVGAIYFAATAAIAFIAVVTVMPMGHLGAIPAPKEMLVGMLVLLLLFIPLLMAYWFAPALVAFDGVNGWDAMKLSFAANLKNIGAFLVYGLILLGLFLLLLVPLGIMVRAGITQPTGNLMIIGPLFFFAIFLGATLVAVTSIYTAYRDIFHSA